MRILNWPQAGDRAITEAVDCLRRGGLVAYPTDTLYGLGAAAGDDAAVSRLFEAKRRPLDQPLPILLSDTAQIEQVACLPAPLALKLASRFWPGPLTLVLPRAPAFHSLALARGDSAAVRVPDHSMPRELIRALGAPITGTSANLSGKRPPQTATDVAAQLGESVDIIIDGGPCPLGRESSVVDLTGESPRLLREGSISRQVLEEAIGSALEEKDRCA
jgi:L-threonylcarbamoyladenylate synthase